MKYSFLILIVLLVYSLMSQYNRGKTIEKYSTGNIKVKHFYEKGQKDKETYLYRKYYNNGNIKEEGNYLKGKQIGEWKCWDKNGNLMGLIHFPEGDYIDKEIQYSWYEKYYTIPKHKDSTKNNFTGIEFHYSNGYKRVYEYEKGKRIGNTVEYYPNGILHYRGTKDSITLITDVIYFDSFGNKIYTEFYDSQFRIPKIVCEPKETDNELILGKWLVECLKHNRYYYSYTYSKHVLHIKDYYHYSLTKGYSCWGEFSLFKFGKISFNKCDEYKTSGSDNVDKQIIELLPKMTDYKVDKDSLWLRGDGEIVLSRM